MISVALFLKEKRTKKGLKQSDVSQKLNYKSSQFISNWERGISYPTIEALEVIIPLYKIDKNEYVNIYASEISAKVKSEISEKLAGV